MQILYAKELITSAIHWFAFNANLLAIFSSPMVALWLQKKVEKINERKERQLEIFKKLLVTLGDNLLPTHVEALNLIEVEFYEENAVKDAWSNYRNHLNNPQGGAISIKEYKEELFIKIPEQGKIDIFACNYGAGFVFLDGRTEPYEKYIIGDIGTIQGLNSATRIDSFAIFVNDKFLQNKFPGWNKVTDNRTKEAIALFDNFTWNKKRQNYLKTLLEKMARYLGYNKINFDTYYPNLYGDVNTKMASIRAGTLEVLEGKRAIKIEMLQSAQVEN